MNINAVLRPVLLCAMAGGLASSGQSAFAEQPEIVWYFPDLPPHYIVDGPHRGEGFHDMALQQVIIPNLPGYTHKVRVVPMLRLLQIMKTEANACAPSAVRSAEREQYMRFSRPDLVMLPPGLFVRRSDEARLSAFLDARGNLILEKLLADGRFRMGMPDGRRYGEKIDKLLGAYDGKRNLYTLKSQDAEKSLVQMVSLSRIDGVFGYPYEATYHLNSTGVEKKEELKFFRLSEQPDYTLSQVACAKGKLGDEVIKKLDAQLSEPAVQAKLQDYYRAWLDQAGVAELRRIDKLNPLNSK